jgi:hypothetical protein
MDSLIIAAKGEYPAINFNGSSGIFSISGKSFPENVNEFYGPIFDYLQTYKKNPKEKTIIEFNWLYFNTATFKIIVKIILSLKELKSQNNEVEVKWYCKPDYSLMIKKGTEIKEVVDIDFKVLSV